MGLRDNIRKVKTEETTDSRNFAVYGNWQSLGSGLKRVYCLALFSVCWFGLLVLFFVCLFFVLRWGIPVVSLQKEQSSGEGRKLMI